MNRMASATGLDGEVTAYTYDKAGRRIQTQTGDPTSASSLTTEYSYDNVGNLLEQATSGASSIAFLYSYNKNGYITGEKRTEDGKTTESAYTYDPMGQLTGFTKSTGYAEQYAYDAAGNMLQKVITGEAGNGNTAPTAVTLKMQYNKANQLISMANGGDKIAYSYDKNGSLVKKVLTSKAYGKLMDTYGYNALDQLTSYMGYDGYQQQLTYDANGMRLSKREAGNSNRSTLEELLRGDIPGLPEIVEPSKSQTNAKDNTVPEELQWATTEYLYDLTQEYYQVIQEKKTGKSGTSKTAYAYGLERIAAYDVDGTGITGKTNYVYDGRGSVAQTVSVPVAGQKAKSALPETQIKVQSFSYTAFGEQMGRKISGFGYNAEAFDAATGMINLRARQYEPAIHRFSQKDEVRGMMKAELSMNRYLYTQNMPISYADSNGMSLRSVLAGVVKIGKRILNAIIPSAKASSATDIASAKAAYQAISTAANEGLSSARKSTNEHVKRIVENFDKRIAGEKVRATDYNALFREECTKYAINYANHFRRNHSKPIDPVETKEVLNYLIYSNKNTPERVKQLIKTSPEFGNIEKIIMCRTDKLPQCAEYMFNAYTRRPNTKIRKKDIDRYKGIARFLLEEHFNDDQIDYYTTPLFAALVGTATRTSSNAKNEGHLNPWGKALISISKTESITLKLAGDTEYITLDWTSSYSFEKQYELFEASQVLQGGDIIWTGDNGKSAPKRKYKNEPSQRYFDMDHVIMALTDTTYAGQNLSAWAHEIIFITEPYIEKVEKGIESEVDIYCYADMRPYYLTKDKAGKLYCSQINYTLYGKFLIHYSMMPDGKWITKSVEMLGNIESESEPEKRIDKPVILYLNNEEMSDNDGALDANKMLKKFLNKIGIEAQIM